MRHFVGWDVPVLRRAATWLMDEHGRMGLSAASTIRGEVDLSRVMVVVPVNRAGRTLSTMLIGLAEERGVLLSLPRVMTPGQLIDGMYGVEASDAGELAAELAVVAWMQRAGRDELEDIFRRDVREDSIGAQMRLARGVLQTLSGLAGEDILPGEVPTRVSRAEGHDGLATFRAEQWMGLGRMTEWVVERLGREGLTLDWHRRLRMVRMGAPSVRKPLVLVGVTELAGLARRAVKGAAADEAPIHAPVHVLVPVPPGLADRFTSLGTLRRGAGEEGSSWSGTLPVRDEELTCVVSAADQAEAALAHVALRAQDDVTLAAADVVIGVPDAEVAAALESLAPQVKGARPGSGRMMVRSAAEIPLATASVAMTTLCLIELVERPTLRSLMTLVSQPDIERAVSARLGAESRGMWMRALDRYASQQPDRRLDMTHLEEWPGVSARDQAFLVEFGAAFGEAVLPLVGVGASEPAAIAAAVQATLARVYVGQRVERDSLEGRSVLGPLKKIKEMVREIRGLSAELAEPLRGKGASATLQVLGAMIEDATLSPEPRKGAIELLGWLDAVMDPAKVLVLTGMNEGRIPSAAGVDPLLPEPMRSALGMMTARDRVERDAYLLEVARRTHETHLVCGRRSDAGDPLLPSRLVLGDASTLAKRVLMAQNPPRLAVRVARRVRAREEDTFGVRPLLEQTELERSGPSAISVTSFGDYLASPYGFYLKHILKLQEQDVSPVEMPAALFGVLIHSALKAWSDSSARDSTDATEILDALDVGLQREAVRSLGRMRRVEVEMQLQIAMLRLRRFSEVQAERRRLGWRVLHTEWEAPRPGEVGCPVLVMGDQPDMPLRGRIDRIDVHEGKNTIAIIDYKTSNDAKKPDNPHRRDGVAGYEDVVDGVVNPVPPMWKSLQLPLYRHLAKGVIPEGAGVEFGLFNLPRNMEEVGVSVLECEGAEVLKSADAAARWVVRKVRAGEFGEEGDVPPRWGTFGYLAGQGLFRADRRKGRG